MRLPQGITDCYFFGCIISNRVQVSLWHYPCPLVPYAVAFVFYWRLSACKRHAEKGSLALPLCPQIMKTHRACANYIYNVHGPLILWSYSVAQTYAC